MSVYCNRYIGRTGFLCQRPVDHRPPCSPARTPMADRLAAIFVAEQQAVQREAFVSSEGGDTIVLVTYTDPLGHQHHARVTFSDAGITPALITEREAH